MTDARTLAVNCTAKLYTFRKTRDGVFAQFVIHPNEVPEKLQRDPIGTSYMMALVEVDDSTGQPKEVMPNEPNQHTPETTPRPLEPGGGVKKGPVWDVIRHCKDVRFQAFAHEKWKDAGMWPLAFKGNESKDNPEDVTAAIIRNWCAVETRADIPKYSHSRAQWDRLAAEYHAETVMA